MKFNWKDLSKEVYEKSKGKLEEMVDDFIGVIRVGEINVDVLVRNYGDEENKMAYSYDFYIANENTGYGYKEESGIHYDYADGTDLFDLTLSYEDFIKESERLIREFVESNDKNGHNYSLVEKANKPLLIW